MIRELTEAELAAEGERLGRSLRPRSVVTFEGDLGAGKTTFVQAIGVTEAATSPTYALVHHYHGRRGPVFHLDAYRLRAPDEAADLDWDRLLGEGDAVLIEWPERLAGWLPPPTARFRLHHVADADRRGLEAL
jgi:tRNA threonylcarbamoyl adenosine modification protein YjeE